jgi:hypothetical protein
MYQENTYVLLEQIYNLEWKEYRLNALDNKFIVYIQFRTQTRNTYVLLEHHKSANVSELI